MLQAFVVVLREGFESFLMVAITVSYLRKTNRLKLIPAVYWGILGSLLASGGLGYLLLHGAFRQSLWEGIFGIVSAVLVTWFVVHMWRTAPKLKKEMENRLSAATEGKPTKRAFFGVLLFTLFMISREGMETALLLLQIHESRIVTGISLGILAAGAMAFLWARFGHLINLKLFFQVTAIFLLLFVLQIMIYSFHEFTEAGIFPHSEALHTATEPFSSEGLYGKWFSLVMVAGCGLWLVGAWLFERFNNPKSLS